LEEYKEFYKEIRPRKNEPPIILDLIESKVSELKKIKEKYKKLKYQTLKLLEEYYKYLSDDQKLTFNEVDAASQLLDKLRKHQTVVLKTNSEILRRKTFDQQITKQMAAINKICYEEQTKRDDFNRKYSDYILIDS
jgi:hypothetical protein